MPKQVNTIVVDYLYMVCCNFYKKREKDIFKISGLILLATVFMLNVQFISYLVEELGLFTAPIYNYKYYIVGASFVLALSILYIRYFKITSYEEVNHGFYFLNDLKKRKIYLYSILYIFLSFAFTFGYAFYKGGIKSGWW